jgi:hypothetical protein
LTSELHENEAGILIIKPTRHTISRLYFGKDPYMFRTDLLSIIRSLNTVFTAVGICRTSYVDCLLAEYITMHGPLNVKEAGIIYTRQYRRSVGPCFVASVKYIRPFHLS